jgi:hypothetical protein
VNKIKNTTLKSEYYTEHILKIKFSEVLDLDTDNFDKNKSELRVVKRGFVEDDDKWFSEEAVIKLKIAQQEIQWLLNRGYKMEPVMNFIGSHYQFSMRQRNALQRSTSSTEIIKNRREKMLPFSEAINETVFIDGFNLIITLEVALSGSVLILGNDETIKDIAGLRGTYSIIDKTEIALELIGKALNEMKVSRVKFYLDSSVSNSGRLRMRILQHALIWSIDTSVELVPNPDPILSQTGRVVTSDSIILDKCDSWFNLARKIVEDYIKDSRIVNLSGES